MKKQLYANTANVAECLDSIAQHLRKIETLVVVLVESYLAEREGASLRFSSVPTDSITVLIGHVVYRIINHKT